MGHNDVHFILYEYMPRQIGPAFAHYRRWGWHPFSWVTSFPTNACRVLCGLVNSGKYLGWPHRVRQLSWMSCSWPNKMNATSPSHLLARKQRLRHYPPNRYLSRLVLFRSYYFIKPSFWGFMWTAPSWPQLLLSCISVGSNTMLFLSKS